MAVAGVAAGIHGNGGEMPAVFGSIHVDAPNVLATALYREDRKAGEHLPPAARGLLGPIDENTSRTLRAMLIAKLNR